MNAQLRIPYDERLQQLFAPEPRSISRGSYEMTQEEDNMVFTMNAPDVTAMRAVFNSITKIVQAWEATKDL